MMGKWSLLGPCCILLNITKTNETINNNTKQSKKNSIPLCSVMTYPCEVITGDVSFSLKLRTDVTLTIVFAYFKSFSWNF